MKFMKPTGITMSVYKRLDLALVLTLIKTSAKQGRLLKSVVEMKLDRIIKFIDVTRAYRERIERSRIAVKSSLEAYVK